MSKHKNTDLMYKSIRSDVTIDVFASLYRQVDGLVRTYVINNTKKKISHIWVAEIWNNIVKGVELQEAEEWKA